MTIGSNYLERLIKENRLRMRYLSKEHQNEVIEMESYLKGKRLPQLECQKFIKESITKFLKYENENSQLKLLSLEDAKQFVEKSKKKKLLEKLVTLFYRGCFSLMLTFFVSVFSSYGSFFRFAFTLSDLLLFGALLLSSYLFRDYYPGIVLIHKKERDIGVLFALHILFLLIYFKLKKFTNTVVFGGANTWSVFCIVSLICITGRIIWNYYWNNFLKEDE